MRKHLPRSLFRSSFLISLLLFVAMPVSLLRAEPTEAQRFLEPFGLEKFSLLYVQALDTFLQADKLLSNNRPQEALDALNALWKEHPVSGASWVRCKSRIEGIVIGDPPCYNSLRMLTECAQWELEKKASKLPEIKPGVIHFTVVLAGKSQGIQPTTMAELQANTGKQQEFRLDPRLREKDHRIIHQSLELFCKYITAVSKGRLVVKPRVVELPEMTVAVDVVTRNRRHFAGLKGGGTAQIIAAVPEDIAASTDWWLVSYPSCVPDQYPDFKTTEFVTGGMGSGPGGSPCFIADDRWVVRKPPHMGHGLYSDIERRSYLPQWLLHEFNHHLFGAYPEFKLEEKSHQWFDRKTWPADFEGRFEVDYYFEAMHKRLATAQTPLWIKLRYAAPSPELVAKIKDQALIGEYRHEPVENDWHEVTLSIDTKPGPDSRPALRWTNKAGKSWQLSPDLKTGTLRVGPDCPYYKEIKVCRLLLRRDKNGDYLPELRGVEFNGGAYEKVDPKPAK